MNLIITNQYRLYTDTQLLGYQGETNARTINVAQPHIDEATAYRLIFDCGNDVIYEVDVTDGEYIVDGGLLINVGTVKCQWQAVKLVGDTYELVAKSNIIEFEVKPSIQGDVAPIPTYEQAKSIIDNFAVQIAEKLDNVAINTDGNLEVTKNEKTDTYVIPSRITDMSFAPAESKLTLWKTVESGDNYMTTIISSVKTSNEAGNALVRKSDGMYVPSVDLSGYYTKSQSDEKYLKRSENIPESLLTHPYDVWDVEVRHAHNGAAGFAPIKKVIEPVVNNILAEQGLLPTYKFSAEGNKFNDWFWIKWEESPGAGTSWSPDASWYIEASPGTAFDFEGIKVLQSVAQNYDGKPSPATIYLQIAVDLGFVQSTEPIGICALSYDYIVVVFDKQLSTEYLSRFYLEYRNNETGERILVYGDGEFVPPGNVAVFDTTSLANRKPNGGSELRFVLKPPTRTPSNDGKHFSWSNLVYIKDIIFTNNPDEIADL